MRIPKYLLLFHEDFEMKMGFIIQGFQTIVFIFIVIFVDMSSRHNDYRYWFSKLLSDNHLKVAGSILTAGK